MVELGFTKKISEVFAILPQKSNWLVVISGIFTGLCFVVPNLGFLAWVLMTPFFYVLFRQTSAKTGFKCSFLFALSLYLVVGNWIFAMQPLGDMNVVASLVILSFGWILFSAYLALFVGGLGALTAILKLGFGTKILFVAAGWFIVELCQSTILGGFPWATLGITQSKYPLLIQGASLWGSFGIGCLLVACNSFFAAGFVTGKKKFVRTAALIFVANLLVGILLINIHSPKENTNYLNIAVLHSNNSLENRWNSQNSNSILQSYLNSAKSAATYWQNQGEQMDLVLLSETAVPYSISPDTNLGKAYLKLSQETKSAVVVGGYDYNEQGDYNALFLIDSQNYKANIRPVYYKQRLVPFGEYTPFSEFLSKILPQSFFDSFPITGLTPGIKQGAIITNFGKFGALICYDSIFSRLLFQPIKEGAEFFVLSSNESWYADSDALHQNLAHAILRAVETNRCVLRSTNGGYSAIISNRGQIITIAKPNNQENYKFLAAKIPLIQNQTFYSKFGQFYVLIFLVLLLGILFWNHKKSK